MQGDGEDIWGSIQRSSSYDPRISPGTPGDVPAFFRCNGKGLSQEPQQQKNWFDTVVAIWNFRRRHSRPFSNGIFTVMAKG